MKFLLVLLAFVLLVSAETGCTEPTCPTNIKMGLDKGLIACNTDLNTQNPVIPEGTLVSMACPCTCPPVLADDIDQMYTPSIDGLLGYSKLDTGLLAYCTEPLSADAVDLRGKYTGPCLTGTKCPMSIEQCGDRVVISGSGVIHDFPKVDGTLANGLTDVKAQCACMSEDTPNCGIQVAAKFEDNCLKLLMNGVMLAVSWCKTETGVKRHMHTQGEGVFQTFELTDATEMPSLEFSCPSEEEESDEGESTDETQGEESTGDTQAEENADETQAGEVADTLPSNAGEGQGAEDSSTSGQDAGTSIDEGESSSDADTSIGEGESSSDADTSIDEGESICTENASVCGQLKALVCNSVVTCSQLPPEIYGICPCTCSPSGPDCPESNEGESADETQGEESAGDSQAGENADGTQGGESADTLPSNTSEGQGAEDSSASGQDAGTSISEGESSSESNSPAMTADLSGRRRRLLKL